MLQNTSAIANVVRNHYNCVLVIFVIEISNIEIGGLLLLYFLFYPILYLLPYYGCNYNMFHD
jgi:hypothetical protein